MHFRSTIDTRKSKTSRIQFIIIYFIFNNQVDGVAMGSPLVPVLKDILPAFDKEQD